LTILVTGSSGFVAQSLIPKLEKLGFDVIGLDWKNGEHTKIIHDISKSLEIEDDIDVVIHLAARLEHEKCSKEEFFKTNVDGTEQVLNLAHSKNAYFIYVSTTAIYGSPECPITENTPIDPNGDYALTKWNGEKICKEYENNGLEVTIIRSGPILGQRRLGIYKTIFKNLQNNSSIPILGDGDNRLSLVHVEDLVDFLIYLGKNKKPRLTVNFGGKIPGSVNQIIQELIRYGQSKSKTIHIPIQLIGFLKLLAKLKIIPVTSWHLSVMHKDNYYENELLFSTGYRYKYEPINALKEMLNYFKQNNKTSEKN
jgi:UDP-glucose 4-epimerase|tara:strand:- start:110 stop:1042 length:933 start_codon:yes stop_codon:yes gene_type:complete